MRKILLLVLIFLVPFLTGCEDNAVEDESIGYVPTDLDIDIPDYLVGTWDCIQGIPYGLVSYELTIDENGFTTQNCVEENGSSYSYTAQCSREEDKFIITDSNGVVLMSFYYSDNYLLTDNLSDTASLFQKV